MKTVTDNLGRSVTYNYPPDKIISFAPAITETLFSLQLQNNIVGRTRFCIHPKGSIEKVKNVGGTKDMKIERIHEINPDLIIVEKEENTKVMVAELEQHYPVFVFEIQTFADALNMIETLGSILNRTQEADALGHDIERAFANFPKKYTGKRAAYVIWQNPYMVVGQHTYIQSLLDKLGFINPFTELEGRYPEVTAEDFKTAELDYVLLATEPFPFQEKHLATFEEMTNGAKTIIVDGEMFWYGVKMLEAVPYFKERLLLP